MSGVVKSLDEEISDFRRRILDFAFRDDGNEKLIKSQIRLPKQFACGNFELFVETTTNHGSVEIERWDFHDANRLYRLRPGAKW